jgi:zinc transport system substrate-binding protein
LNSGRLFVQEFQMRQWGFSRISLPFRLFALSPLRPFLFTLLALVLGAGTVLAQSPPPAEKIPVAASIGPLGDFCRKIGGERVEVTVLIPPGASPHVFEPTPQAVAQAMGARVFVYVGAGLDPWAERLVKTREGKGLVAVEATAGLPLLSGVDSHGAREGAVPTSAGGSHKHDDQSKGHRHARGNPHVWLDPVLAQDICRRLATALIQADPPHREAYDKNLGAYLNELKELDQEIARRVATLKIKEFVAFHPSFTYFARRYGLTEAGVIERAPGREPTPGHIRRIVDAIKKFQVRVVFAEPQLSSRVAEVIAREAGVKVLMLDPLGGRPPYGNDYLLMMRHNLAVLAKAMQ